MKKETTTKSKLWIWIVAAAVLLLAVGGVVLALLLGGQNNGPAVDPVSGPRPDLYWNLDREFYTANSQTGLSTREADANGQFKMRFAYNGEIVELVIIDKKLVNIIDTQDILGLTFDENGVVIGQTNIRELATEVGKKIYVKKATADTIEANSSMAMNGMDLNLAMGQYAEVYDLRMDSETLGKKLAPTDLQVMDCITVYSNAAGDITHVYLLNNATRSKLYWRANLWVSSSVNRGGLDPDENGVYTLPFYCEGELVNVKTKDVEIVDYYAEMGKHTGFTGLIFDDDGYAIDIMNAAVGIAGQRLVYAMDVVSVDGTTVSLKNNWTTSGAMEWTGTIPEDVPIWNINSWAYVEGVMGQKMSVKDLKIGDRITIFADLEGNIVEAGVTLRRVDLKPMFNNSSKYDAATRSTTRVKDADGYWVYTFIHEKGISKYKTKDQKLANYIDSYPERVFGIVTKGEILVKAYEYECIYGYTRFSTALYVDAINGTILSCSDNKKANAYTAVLAEDYKVLDISGDSKEYGTKINLQENDCMISFRNTNKEVCMIYVTKRAMGGSLYVNTEPNTSREPITTNDKGETIKNPYWEFKMTDINGKQVTLKLPTGKQDKEGVYANKYLQSRIDNASRGIIALEVSSKTIKGVHTVGNMASGNSVGTVIITKPGTEEFEYKTAAKPNDEASIYPGWTGKEGLKMINISATTNKYHGEKLSGGMKVNDVYYMVRNRANETVALFLYGRGLHNDFYFVKNPQGYVNGETIREKNAAGYYVIDVMYQGKATQVQTKDSKLAAKLDSMYTGAALKLDKSTKPYTVTAVSDYTGTNDAFKSEVGNWDVTSVKSGNVTLKLNIPTATTEVGITQTLNISGAKIYNLSPDAGDNFGKTTKLQKNDRVRIYSDKNGKITYVLVTVRNGVKTALCEHCGKKVTWNPLTASSGVGVGDGHYYVFQSRTVYAQQASVSSTSIDKYEVVIDLNGKTLTQAANNTRIFQVVYPGKTLTMMDSVGGGALQGYGIAYARNEDGTPALTEKGGLKSAGNGNVLQAVYGGTLNILSGTYRMITEKGKIPSVNGGVIFGYSREEDPKSVINIKGGTIEGGKVQHPLEGEFSTAGAIRAVKADINVSGGVITGGTADRGGNINLASGSNFTMTGGVVQNGTATDRGGNIYGASGTTITISGGTVIGGKTTGKMGGNIYGHVVNVKGGEVIDGTAATTGGNIFVIGTDLQLNVSGGKISGGTAASGGGNIYSWGGDGVIAVSGGEIDDSGVFVGPETEKNNETNVYEIKSTSTLNVTGGKIGDATIGNKCAIIVGEDVQIDNLTMVAGAEPMIVTALSKNAKIAVSVAEGKFGKAAEGEKNVDLEAYANNQIVSADKQMGKIFVEKDEKGVKWLVAGKKGTVDEIFGQIIADALKMTADGVFAVADGAEPAVVEANCPYCKQKVQWAPLSTKILEGMTPNDQNSYVLDTHTHYYLADDITLPAVAEKATRLNAVKGTEICLHLNGKTLDQNTDANTMGAILVTNGATLTIMGDGNVTGAGLAHKEGDNMLYGGGAIDARGIVNILGGTYKTSRADRPAVAAFGGNSVLINVFAGTITKGAAEDTSNAYSSNVRLYNEKHTFNLYGGTIEGGMAENGGNVRMHGGTFNLDGGTITGGTSANLGGNVCVRGGTFNLKSGSLLDGTTASSGGSIGLVSGTLNISGGTFSGGKASTGGLVYVYGGKLNISGGEIKGGAGTNIYIAGGTNDISGGKIDGGVVVAAECALTVSGDAKIASTNKGLRIVDGAQLLVGELSDTASVAVTANGKFAKAAEDAENVDVAAYANKQIVSTDKRMGTIIVESDKDGVKWLAAGTKGTVKEIFEQIIADAKKMTADGVFAVADGAEPAVVEAECPYCMEKVQWAPLTAKILEAMTPNSQNSYILDTHTHYYLADDILLPAVSGKATRLNVASGSEICLHLNGKTLDQNATGSSMGALLVTNGGTLTVMGEGTVVGTGLTYTDKTLGTLYSGGAIDARGTVNILDGTYSSARADRPAVATFGAGKNAIQVNMYGGEITKGGAENKDSEFSSNVRTHYKTHVFNMYGGSITNGLAKSGANVTLADGTFNLYDGKITGGTAAVGGNVYVHSGAIFNVNGGEITDGVSNGIGCNIMIDQVAEGACSTVNLTAGKLSGGIYVAEGCVLTASGDVEIDAQWSGLQIAEGGELHIGKLGTNAVLPITAEGKFAKAADETVDLTALIGKQIVAAKPDLCTISVVKDDQQVNWLSAANTSILDVYGHVAEKAQAQAFTGTSVEDVCEYCGKTVTWTGITQAMVDTALATTSGYVLDTAAHTHYFLAEDITMPAFEDKPTRFTTTASAKSVVCLHLNGKTLDQNAGTASANGVLFVASGTTMNIMGNGVVTGTGVVFNNMYGGALDVRGSANIFGGAYYSSNPDRPAVALFSEATGAAARDEQLSARVINMFGGTIVKGASAGVEKEGSSNVWLNCGVHKFNMYGGSIEGGEAKYGGNLHIKDGTFTMYGGTITGGTAQRGGNIYPAGGTFNLVDGTVSDGTNTNNLGGHFYITNGTVNIKGGKLLNATGVNSGGAIGMNGSGKLNISGGVIDGATTKNDGGLIYIYNGSLNISGGELKNGSGRDGGLINVGNASTGTVTITGGTFSGGTASRDGGLIYLNNNAEITGGTFANGTAANGKGINVASKKTLTLGATTEAVDVRLNANSVLNVQNGTKANVEFTANTAKLVLADDLAAGTAITVAYGANDEAPLSEANAKIADYVKEGFLVSANPARGLKIKDDQIYVASLTTVANDLSTLFATVPEGKQYHEAYCPACGKLAQWVAITNQYVAGLTASGNNADLYYLDGGAHTHYYLAEDITMPTTGAGRATRFQTATADSVTCLHLNDKTLNQNATGSTEGVLKLSAGTTTNIMDGPQKTGTVVGAGSKPNDHYTGGALDARGTVNIYGGTYKTSRADRPAVGLWSDTSLVNMYGGKIVKGDNVSTTTPVAGANNVYIRTAKGTFNMYGGEITDGAAKMGGNVYMANGIFNMSGGTISGGKVTRGTTSDFGGNVAVMAGTFTMTGGTITGGEASRGGNIYTASGSKFTMSGGTVSNGTADNLGGNIYVKGTVEISGGTIDGGTATNGGLIYVASGTLKITGGELKNGVGAGGNILIGGGTNTITGGTISGGKDNTGVARDVAVNGSRTLTLGKNANIEKLYVGGTVTVQNGTVATVELSTAGKIAFANDVAAGTEITVITSATQDIAEMTNAADYLTYFKEGVEGAKIAVKENSSEIIVMTLPAAQS